ncbi:MAG: flagellar biosynthesis protein FliQ [Syntrophomonadaceae bacterium]|nr:flagellar biosynthesis protein FliQ [Syntrophomonadaceae bacterium]
MDSEFVMYLAREALYTTLLLSAPILGGSLLIGLLVSVFQATTQIQEQTLTFVPKIVAVMVIVAVFGPWMLNLLLSFTSYLFGSLHTYTFIR